ncbi:MAG TPA: PaaI family thioesterase [Terriglobales bacterium]|nr:PaaI family thioesterase [Terriglobales bacterium]
MPKKKRAHGHDTKHVQMRRNYCFACGVDNPHGMHLKFSYDAERDAVVGRIRLPRRYWGPPKHAHGGIIATVLDEAMGKVNRKHHVVALTSEMKVHYLKPVPLSKPLMVEARERTVRGRRHVNVAEIRDERGEVLARGEAVFIAVDPHRMFAKYLPASERRRLLLPPARLPAARRKQPAKR